MKSYRRTNTVRINAAQSSKVSLVHFKKGKIKRNSQPCIHHMLPICLGPLISQYFSYFPEVTGP